MMSDLWVAGSRLPERLALLLDFDGTLIDFAPTPDAVVVPPSLPGLLRGLRQRFGDAVAIVSGRPMQDIDRFLGDAPYAVAAEHGALFRYGQGAPWERVALPAVPGAWREQARQVAARHPGTLYETKENGFAIHYRQAPQAKEAVQQALQAIIAGATEQFAVMGAHMAWEVVPRGADKGQAVDRLMARPPFAGRVPVYIGDDVTDEDAIRAAQLLGGVGLRVQDAFGTPADVRAWLATLVQKGAA